MPPNQPIASATICQAMFDAVRMAATHLPPDVHAALARALAEETDPLARQHLELSLANAAAAAAGDGLACADTGFPLFFVTAGARTSIEGGFGTLWRAAEAATARATEANYLRPTMVHPLERTNPGNNVGLGMPKVELHFDGNGDGLEIIACPKGGGSEIFGTFYRMLYPSDGEPGILKFVIETIGEGSYAGKVCPPAIIGVGIGGTADLCMKMAKEAALLRPIGSVHPDPHAAELERKLLAASRQLGLGPMGSRGVNAVLAVHLALAHTHTAALPVAVNAQCLVGRRWKALLTAAGDVALTGVFA